ncbi:hypothetical protein JCM8097_001707 [Rhodosporidiobolus ruineniae]
MTTQAPIIALVGATGLVGSALLSSFVDAVQSSRIASLRILTASPSSPKLSAAKEVKGVEVREIAYSDAKSLEKALQGVEVLVSAMGASETSQGRYQENKERLVEAAVKAGVKVYVPSSWGTDFRGKNQEVIQSPMFANKIHHHEDAQKRGLQVLEIYNGLILEISFSDWLGIPISSPSPTWTIPTPAHPVAFTSLSDLGPFTLSAILQTLSSSTAPSNASAPVPSHLRVYSDCVTIDQAADWWEKYAGGKVQREYKDAEGLRERYEEIRPTLKEGMLGPAIPLMMALGGFNHTVDSAVPLLNFGDFAFEPKTVEAFLREKAEELKS